METGTGSRQRARRWRGALSVLGWIERRSGAPTAWQRRVYRVHGVHAVYDPLDPGDLERPLSAMARQVPPWAGRMSARCRADLVRLGKFDVDEVVRFRAFHCTEAARCSLRVQAHANPARPGVERDVAARAEVARYVPELAPPLLEHGRFPRRRLAYLREAIVAGRHPRDPNEVQQLLPALVGQLARLYAGVGVHSRPLSTVVSPRLLERWTAFAHEAAVRPAAVRAVHDLLRRDAHLPVSLGHGDLVRTNILIVRAGVVLIDWEHARSMPIAFDLAKPVFLSHDDHHAVEVIRKQLPTTFAPAPASYTLEEQVGLALVQMLSWSGPRAARAAAAGRSGLLERDSRLRLRLLERLLT